jgi:hypothetical protein
MDGRMRHIQVKLSDGKYHLAYRRGYYATNDFMSPAPKVPPKEDPLRPLMDHGTPDATGILYTMKVIPAATQPRTLEAGGAVPAGDNGKLSGVLTRYSVTFAIPPENLALDTSADGAHQGKVEATLLAYDRNGTPVNWLVRMVGVRVPRERYVQAQANGVGFHLDIDVPTSGVYLRSGLYDMESNKAGTMEIPIAAVVASTAPSHDGVRHPPAPLPAPAASTNVPVPTSSVSPGPNLPATLSLTATQELEGVDIPKYCADIAGNQEHSSSLAAICEFVLNLRKQLSNIICDRQTRRYWTALSASVDDAAYIEHSDVVTVNVTYHDGQESYSDFRVDGKPVPANAPELSVSWSHGEFATLLASIFAPSSKAQFHYSKQTKLHSNPALVFDFNIAAQNNRLYFLQSRGQIWFPEYGGSIWIDARTSSLLRLQVETAPMPNYPIRHTKAEIEYSNLLLGDGTSMVLPTNSNDQICGLQSAWIDNCARNVIKFMHWHKFRATTNVLMPPAN